MNARHIPSLFPAGSLGTAEIESRAKAEIWQDWESFTATAKQAQDAALALLALTKDADEHAVAQEQIVEATKALGQACKSCHKKFRIPKRR
jgi:cytochrome c556